MKRFFFLICLFLPFISFAQTTSSKNENSKLDVYIFNITPCPSCEQFKEEFYPELKKQFDSKVNFYDYALADFKGAQLYSKLTKGCKAQGVPVLVVGNQCIAGYPADIKDKTVSAINSALKGNGKTASPSKTSTNKTANKNSTKKNKPIVYVYLSPTCPYCQQFKRELYPQLKKRYGDEVNFYEPSPNVRPGSEDERFFKKAKAKCDKIAVPLILVGNKCIIGYSGKTTKDAVITALDKFTDTGKTIQVISWRD